MDPGDRPPSSHMQTDEDQDACGGNGYGCHHLGHANRFEVGAWNLKFLLYFGLLPSMRQGDSNSSRFMRSSLRGFHAPGAAERPVRNSLDHLVGAGEKRGWNGKRKHLCSLEVDHQLQFGRLLHWQICWSHAL